MIRNMSSDLSIEKPADFSFRHTVNSHGWYDLAPFVFDETAGTLEYVFRDGLGGPVVIGTISDAGTRIRVKTDSTVKDRKKIIADVRHILRIDDEMERFYDAVKNSGRLKWVNGSNAGRLLRSPTVFEDLVKTLCTTNCSWSLTRKMVANLVDALGEPAPNGKRAFPTAQAMASQTEAFYRDRIKAGYRSPYFVEMAEGVAAGRFDPESWLRSERPTAELKKEIKSVKGFGDYAAENLLKLLGRYDGLALDSWLRSQFYKKHNNKKKCPDKKIERHYREFGEWQGLALWCDMTEEWFDR